MIHEVACVVTNCQQQNKGTVKMEEPARMMLMLVSDGLLQEAFNKLIAGLGGAAVAWYVGRKYNQRKDRNERLDKAYDTLFGMDDVHTMEGVVEVLETHEEDIEELERKVEEYRDKQKEIEQRVENLTEKIRGRKSHGDE